MEFLKNYELPLSLWNMIIENVAPNEIFEVKSFLGDDLVDQSNELRSEIITLMEIYKAYSVEQAAGDSAQHFLPEPPELRERLMKEIIFFVNGIREQAHLQGRNPNEILENRQDIIDYAYESSSSRPTTSNDSCLSTSRSSYRATPNSDSGTVNLFKKKLNYIEFEEVQKNLKQFLEDEVNQLQTDLLELHTVLYNDDISLCHSRNNKYTISELKQERHELEQILLQSSQSKPNTASTNTRNNQTSIKYPKKSLFRLIPDSEIANKEKKPASIKSPQKLQPIKPQDKIPSYVESPLDLGLPETVTSSFNNVTDRNNSSLSNGDLEDVLRDYSPTQNNVSKNPMRYNSAQKFRQRILQNRKESSNN